MQYYLYGRFFLKKKGSSINTSSSGSRTSEGGSRENHSNTSTACKPVVDDGDSHDENERHTTEMAGPSEKDVCDHDLEFIAFRKIRFKLCKNAGRSIDGRNPRYTAQPQSEGVYDCSVYRAGYTLERGSNMSSILFKYFRKN